MTLKKSHQLLVLVAIVTLIPIGVLAWLTISILRNDRDVEHQRHQEALQIQAGRIGLEVERRLAELEQDLRANGGLTFTPAGITATGGPRPLFQPEAPPTDPRDSNFAVADIDEQQGRLDAATEACRALAARSDDAIVKAEALLRIGRIAHKAGRQTDALDAFAQLERLDTVPAAGVPSSLIASFARGRLFAASRNAAALSRAGVELAAKLTRGGWAIDRVTFDNYAAAANEWGGAAPDADAVVRTQAAIGLWRQWRNGELSQASPVVLGDSRAAFVALWTASADGSPVARLMTPAELIAAIEPAWSAQPVHVSAFRTDGGVLFGANDTSGIPLLPKDTRLPFVLNVASTSTDTADAGRRAIFIGAIACACALILGAAIALYRTTIREIGLARQQADFVSAVSHEFRTPLTSMRHILDLLANRGVSSDERRNHYYGLLTGEADRLHRMVETLLSFGRIEAGAYAWELRDIDMAQLIDRTVAEFRDEVSGRGRDIRVEHAGLPTVRADAEALSRAVWNLLDNAAKYSPHDAPIVVFARVTDAGVALGVRDRGRGIDPAEQERIFQKFVRGADAKAAGTRGVGIGLALVKTIALAHRGAVTVQSTPGEGSTFTIVLPRTT